MEKEKEKGNKITHYTTLLSVFYEIWKDIRQYLSIQLSVPTRNGGDGGGGGGVEGGTP